MKKTTFGDLLWWRERRAQKSRDIGLVRDSPAPSSAVGYNGTVAKVKEGLVPGGRGQVPRQGKCVAMVTAMSRQPGLRQAHKG